MDDLDPAFDPALALAAVHGTRADLADRLRLARRRYTIIFTALVGFAVGSQALPPPFNVLGSGLTSISLAWLCRMYVRKTGVWVSGVTPRRARWAALTLGLVVGLCCVFTFIMARQGQPLAGLPAAAISMVVAAICKSWWWRLYQLDLLDTRAAPPQPFGLVIGIGGALMLTSLGLYLIHVDTKIVGMILGMGGGLACVGAFFKRRGLSQAR